jgi:predicted DNA-binding transcriptional regulator YafY
MHTATRPPLARLAVIDKTIRAGGFPNARTLARDLDVNSRTIQRDLQFLRDRLQAPLAFDPARNGYIYTDRTFCLPFHQFTEGELIALLLAERLLQEYRNTPYAEALAAAFQKITAALPETVSIDLAHLTDAFSFRHQALDAGDMDRFVQLSRAVREGRQLDLLYWSASRDETARRIVDPYHLTSTAGDWHLIAHCHLRKEVRMFAPSRIRELHETGARFDRPANFHAADYLDAGFRAVRGTGPPRQVRLRFRPAAARYVRERRWHKTQRLDEQADGGLVLTLHINHLLEVRRWALSFGADCEVLEPEELRAEVMQEIERLAALYESSAAYAALPGANEKCP